MTDEEYQRNLQASASAYQTACNQGLAQVGFAFRQAQMADRNKAEELYSLAMRTKCKNAEELKQEEERQQTATNMKTNPSVRRFMEKVLPIDWCHRLYPEVYA